jgi:hypothetical protein
VNKSDKAENGSLSGASREFGAILMFYSLPSLCGIEVSKINFRMRDNLDQTDSLVIGGNLAALGTVEVAVALADVRAQAKIHIKTYHDKLLRWEARRKNEKDRFDESSDRIRRHKRGWSAISDRELAAPSPGECERARKARGKRDQRAREVKPATPAPVIAPVVITLEGFNDRLARLQGWLALPGPQQRHLRGREADIMRVWVLYHDHVGRHGKRPTFAQFASAFTVRFNQPMTRQVAQKRLALLDKLETAGGPFEATS